MQRSLGDPLEQFHVIWVQHFWPHATPRPATALCITLSCPSTKVAIGMDAPKPAPGTDLPDQYYRPMARRARPPRLRPGATSARAADVLAMNHERRTFLAPPAAAIWLNSLPAPPPAP